MLTPLINAVQRWGHEHRQRSQLRALIEKDDRILEDLGLRRADAEEALGRPSLENAREHAYNLSRRSLALDRLR